MSEDFEILALPHGLDVGAIKRGEERSADRVAFAPPRPRSSARADAGFEDRGYDVDEMGELGADAALVPDASGPGDNHRIARAAKVGGDLLHPLEGRVAGPGPPVSLVLIDLSPSFLRVLDHSNAEAQTTPCP